MCVFRWVCIGGGQKLMSDIFLDCTSSNVFLDLVFHGTGAYLFGWAGQPVNPQILLSLPLQHWGYRHVPLCLFLFLFFIVFVVIVSVDAGTLMSSCLCSRHFFLSEPPPQSQRNTTSTYFCVVNNTLDQRNRLINTLMCI